ncbi:C40 family peptidase [Arenibacter sp. F20364]|uniref:C40 family peptidase n=1 Tax=Arenibacter sp. F20364 TaxID=2926415 RepID=UPI001FF6BFA1|nr:C40 family peptidase [Arenibacter sp. F20364]MCK0191021.1 C40 family peptidase [Arenibacter sp. F20364]
MIQRFLSLFLIILLVGCGAAKNKNASREERKITVEASEKPTEIKGETPLGRESISKPLAKKTQQIINTALTFSGTRYKFGGTTNNGMDCSGLLYVAFGEHDIQLPRASYQMAEEGQKINLKEVDKGDLLFFGTSRRKNNINHVGLVVQVDGDDIKFIHSTSSRGVIVSSLQEGYWNYAFIKAARVL